MDCWVIDVAKPASITVTHTLLNCLRLALSIVQRWERRSEKCLRRPYTQLCFGLSHLDFHNTIFVIFGKLKLVGCLGIVMCLCLGSMQQSHASGATAAKPDSKIHTWLSMQPAA